MNKLLTYTWDANIFIAWLGSESEHLPAISAVITEIEDGKANLAVPSIVYSEVLQYHRTRKDQHICKNFMKRSNIFVLDVTVPLATLASEIRDKGKAARPKREIGTCDAIYMATALIAQSHAFHTTESRLLRLDGTPIVDKLRICLPQTKSGNKLLF